MSNNIYDRRGNQIDMLKWAELKRDADYYRVGRDEIGDVVVSTVWLGLDHSWDDKPLIFETMVFGGPLDEEQARYSTESEAIAGHAVMLARVIAAQGQQS